MAPTVSFLAGGALMLAACSTAESKAAEKNADVDVVSAPPAGELTRPDTLTVCTETGTPPAAYYDEESDLTGYLPEIGRAIAARMGLEAAFVDSVFDTIIVAANTGKCDIVIADQFITDEREEQIDMVPYAQIGQQFLGRAEDIESYGDPIADPTKLCGLRIGALLGAAQVDNLEQMSKDCVDGGNEPINISTTTTTPAGLQSLQGGQSDLFFTDSPVSSHYAEDQPEIFATVGEPIDNVNAGISVSFDKPGVKASLIEVLKAMGEDGSYKEIFDDWGESAMAIEAPGA